MGVTDFVFNICIVQQTHTNEFQWLYSQRGKNKLNTTHEDIVHRIHIKPSIECMKVIIKTYTKCKQQSLKID